MRFKGIESIQAPRDKVWQFITDPHAFSQCVPGLQSIDVVVPGQMFRAVAAVELGAFKALFTITVTYHLIIVPTLADFRAVAITPDSEVRASSSMTLTETAEGHTDIDWQAKIDVYGTMASLAGRLLESIGKKVTAEFFNCVKQKLES